MIPIKSPLGEARGAQEPLVTSDPPARCNAVAADFHVAVLVPCYNEAVAIQHVIRDFRAALPSASIYVYDNNSTDQTVVLARAAGAIVRSEPRQGKGNVIQRMFSDVEADVYVLVDGDNTYDASVAPRMIERLIDGALDMVVGRRVASTQAAYRPGHRFGNNLLTGVVAMIFGNRTSDMLSGYRIFSRRFVKSFPALSRGFEIETELTVHALELRMPIADVDTRYADRLPGSSSKLSTIKDGFRILGMIGVLVKEERPMQFFGLISGMLALLSVALIYPVFVEYMRSGLVPRFPTAILSSATMIVAILSFFAGLILDSVTHGRREMKRLAYLGLDSISLALERAQRLDAGSVARSAP
jgi:glycosyltransferase involved in cell wall biosynthesis